MLDRSTSDPAAEITRWTDRLALAIAEGDRPAFDALFCQDSHWRDLLAFTWRLQTVSGHGPATSSLWDAMQGMQGLAVAPDRLAPHLTNRANRDCMEAFLAFDSPAGHCTGVLRLVPEDGEWRAWTLMTALDEIHDHPEITGRERPTGNRYARDFRGPNWSDLRAEDRSYTDRDPAVLVVGGGQAGLAIGARLRHLGVDALIIDRNARIGDNWRLRYHALTLHNQVQVNHLPYMPFPASWPTYIPKDKLANWFEAYVEAMELNFWTSTECLGGHYDEATGQWETRLRLADGAERVMRPRHVVMATGVSGIPNRPEIATLDRFQGEVLHSSQYTDGEDWTGKSAIVIGTGNSGHDISQDLASAGAQVSMFQRSPSMVVNLETAQLPYALYDTGPDHETCDLIAQGTPVGLVRGVHRDLTIKTCEMDKELLNGLSARGFRHQYGEDGTGWQFKYLTRGGGYYFNVGASDMVVDGTIGLEQFAEIESFSASGATMKDGREIPADLVVLATGYRPQEELVARLFGEDTAMRVGKIWGYESPDAQELSNMFCRTGQPGLWFIAGSLAQCRIFSKYLGLQIKADLVGKLPETAG